MATVLAVDLAPTPLNGAPSSSWLRLPSPRVGRWLHVLLIERWTLRHVDRRAIFHDLQVWSGRSDHACGGWRQQLLEAVWPLASITDSVAVNDDGFWMSIEEVALWAP